MCRFGLGIPLTPAESAVEECLSVCVVQYVYIFVIAVFCFVLFFFQSERNDCADAGIVVYGERYSCPVRPAHHYSGFGWQLRLWIFGTFEHHDIIFLHGFGVALSFACCVCVSFCLRPNFCGCLKWKSFKTSSFLSSKVMSDSVYVPFEPSLPHFYTMLFMSNLFIINILIVTVLLFLHYCNLWIFFFFSI